MNRNRNRTGAFALILCGALGPWFHEASGGGFRGRVIDERSGRPVASRVYLRNEAQEWLFVRSAAPEGTALPYREQWVPMADSVERHTTVSAHPFAADLPPGDYHVEIERGKEYFPWRGTIRIGEGPGVHEKEFLLRRWIDMAGRGWYSGETHVHRRIAELTNVMLAEDLNAAFPVTFWTTEAEKAPGLEPSTLRRQGPSPFGPREDRGYDPIYVDPTHVIFPRNTEYEIFSIGKKPHVLGALFVLNHRSVFDLRAPPVGPIAARAREEGALLDLDKHSWPWSMMLAPVAKVDLFELSNNSVWRTAFGFKQASIAPAPWMGVEMESEDRMTEWGWLNFGFEVYYGLLNCGFPLAPTAGTASGVHPVPLGHSRAYVFTGNPFSAAEWLRGLKMGRSFVTTGPMLFATLDGAPPGERFEQEERRDREMVLKVETVSERALLEVEVIVNGLVVERLKPELISTPEGAWRGEARRTITARDSSWVAVRCVEPREDGRKRFAHTGPWHLRMGGRQVAPRAEQVEYFAALMEQQIARNRGVLAPEALAEFETALRIYREILERAERR